MCCRVNQCCFCIDHILGVKLLGCFLILINVAVIVLGTFYLPQFLFAIVPTFCIGIICDILLLVAVFRSSRWFMLPWLIFVMILIVGLALASVLRIVIPLGMPNVENWLPIILTSIVCLIVATIWLYFWIVVLELFIRLGPEQNFGGVIYNNPGIPMAPGPYMGPVSIGAPQYGVYQQPPPPVVHQSGYFYPQGALVTPQYSQ